MTLEELYNLLNRIEGFANKVAYRAFPEGGAPKLPFICYLVRRSDNFNADDRVYLKNEVVDVELYSKEKDLESELAVESAFNEACIGWSKTETYIESEKVNEVIYSITI